MVYKGEIALLHKQKQEAENADLEKAIIKNKK
jgi:hypothetical protein